MLWDTVGVAARQRGRKPTSELGEMAQNTRRVHPPYRRFRIPTRAPETSEERLKVGATLALGLAGA